MSRHGYDACQEMITTMPDLHRAVKTAVLDRQPSGDFRVLLVRLQNGKNDATDSVHVFPSTYMTSGLQTTDMLAYLGFARSRCSFEGGDCYARAVETPFDLAAFVAALPRTYGALCEANAHLAGCGILLAHPEGLGYFFDKISGDARQHDPYLTGDGHTGDTHQRIRHEEDPHVHFAPTSLRLDSNLGWTTHYRSTHEPMSPEILSAFSFLNLAAFPECPEFDFEACFWRFTPYMPTDWGGNGSLVISQFDAHPDHFLQGLEALLRANMEVVPFDMGFLPSPPPLQPRPGGTPESGAIDGIGGSAGKPPTHQYDVAISFAGPERPLAVRLARSVQDAGFHVFDDDFYPEHLWGKNLVEFFDDVYRTQSRYCVMLVSPEYRDRMWTTHERQSAQARAAGEGERERLYSAYYGRGGRTAGHAADPRVSRPHTPPYRYHRDDARREVTAGYTVASGAAHTPNRRGAAPCVPTPGGGADGIVMTRGAMMNLTIGDDDALEMLYKPAFKALAARAGLGIEYEHDRAGLDWGLHVTERQDGVLSPTQTRVWFQLKGIGKDSLPAATIEHADHVAVRRIRLAHLRQWYRAQEATYLVVYVESIDAFFAQDVVAIVAHLGGEAVLHEERETITIKMPTTARVDDAFWQRLRDHRSMRIDVASFRGVPLPHSRDVRSSILTKMEPTTFTNAVETLLAAHRYQAGDAINVAPLYPDASASGDIISGSYGVLYDPYEWSPQLYNELIADKDGLYKEGRTLRSHGRCAVLVHSRVVSRPDAAALGAFIRALPGKRIDNLLIFVNHYMYASIDGTPYNCFPEYVQASIGSDIECMPQHLEDLARSILARPHVYLPVQDKIGFWGDDVQRRIKTGELRIL